LSRVPAQFACLVILSLLASEMFALSSGSTRVIKSVRVIREKGVPAVEIVSSDAVNPNIRSVASPPQLVIDIPDARPGLTEKTGETQDENILAIWVNQVRNNPPMTRIVLELSAPYGHSVEKDGDRLVVRLRPPEESSADENSSDAASGFSLTTDAGLIPVAGGSTSSVTPGSRISGGSSLTAGAETTILHLPRGGEVRVCRGTTVSIATSKSKRDLMFGMSTGAIEAHYSLETSADAVLTPDFRIMFAGPGHFDYAISADAHGNTCVRALKGNTSSAVVSELMGDRIYQVKPSEEVVFRAGQINRTDNDIPLDCGCPPPPAVMRAESPSAAPSKPEPDPKARLGTGTPATSIQAEAASPAGIRMSNGPETAPVPPTRPNETHVEIDAPLVFNAKSRAEAVPPAPVDVARELPIEDSPDREVHLDPVVQSPPAAETPSKPEHRGFFGRVRGFFSSIFGKG